MNNIKWIKIKLEKDEIKIASAPSLSLNHDQIKVYFG